VRRDLRIPLIEHRHPLHQPLRARLVRELGVLPSVALEVPARLRLVVEDELAQRTLADDGRVVARHDDLEVAAARLLAGENHAPAEIGTHKRDGPARGGRSGAIDRKRRCHAATAVAHAVAARALARHLATTEVARRLARVRLVAGIPKVHYRRDAPLVLNPVERRRDP
jgi:hypothetical protein